MCSVFTQKQVFGPHTAKSQPTWIKLWHTYNNNIVHRCYGVQNTLVGRLRPRSASGRLQAKPERLCFFVIFVTHSKSYLETTDRHDFSSKPSQWRWGRVISWKILEFCSMGGARSQNSIFRVFKGTLQLSCTQPTRNSLPQTMVPMESRDSEGVPFASLEAFGRYRPLIVPKSGHVTSQKLKICM